MINKEPASSTHTSPEDSTSSSSSSSNASHVDSSSRAKDLRTLKLETPEPTSLKNYHHDKSQSERQRYEEDPLYLNQWSPKQLLHGIKKGIEVTPVMHAFLTKSLPQKREVQMCSFELSSLFHRLSR
jgi:hypothetical protein